MERLQREADSLREQIRDEQRRRQSRVSDLSEQLRGVEGQNRQLQMQLSQLQLHTTSKVSDATALKREVVSKTMELEKLVREFQQSQSDLFSRAQSISHSLLQMSGTGGERGEREQSPNPCAIPFSQNANGHSAHSAHAHQRSVPSPCAAASQFASLGPLDDETLEALKRRLQSLGDVVVFTSDKFDACSASGHSIPPGAVRVRPRKCDHVFLIECLMPYWVEGLCPVCRCSFAYSREVNDESDKCSSVSTSVSQRARLVSQSRQPPLSHIGEDGGFGTFGGSRGPKVLRSDEMRQRSTSCGARSDVSGLGDGRIRSPSRSGISGSLSRTSSGRDRPL
ncbi:Hypothetical protein (Fragment) [Durusdinium trenchii]